MAAPRPVAHDFCDLLVWRKAHEFVLTTYKLTSDFPRTEIYGLTSQMRRAAVSIPANIAEGFRRRGRPDKARFMNLAEASLDECRYYLMLARDLGYADTDSLATALQEISRMLRAYAEALLAPNSSTPSSSAPKSFQTSPPPPLSTDTSR